jgi:hypothetical protein
MCTDSLLEQLTASLVRQMRERHPDYEIGVWPKPHRRFYAYRRAGSGPHTIITDDPDEIAQQLRGW